HPRRHAPDDRRGGAEGAGLDGRGGQGRHPGHRDAEGPREGGGGAGHVQEVGRGRDQDDQGGPTPRRRAEEVVSPTRQRGFFLPSLARRANPYRCTRAEPPLANASTSSSRAIVTSPW